MRATERPSVHARSADPCRTCVVETSVRHARYRRVNGVGRALVATLLVSGIVALSIPTQLESLVPGEEGRVGLRPGIVLILRESDCEGYSWYAKLLARRMKDGVDAYARVVVVRSLRIAEREKVESRRVRMYPAEVTFAWTAAPIRPLPPEIARAPALVLLDPGGSLKAVFRLGRGETAAHLVELANLARTYARAASF